LSSFFSDFALKTSFQQTRLQKLGEKQNLFPLKLSPFLLKFYRKSLVVVVQLQPTLCRLAMWRIKEALTFV
jgi:hypothetical protein